MTCFCCKAFSTSNSALPLASSSAGYGSGIGKTTARSGDGSFFLSRPGLDKNTELQFRYFHEKLLAGVSVPVHGFSYGFENFCMLVLVVAVIVAYWRNPEFRWNGPWVFVLPSLFAFYWLLPLSWGQTFDIDIRLLPA